MISYVKSRPKDSLYRRPIIATNRHTCSEKNSYVGWKRSICSVKRLSPLGKGATYSNEATYPARGAAPWTPPGAPPLGPRRGAAPHPARGAAPWTPPGAPPLGTPFLLFIFNCTFGSTSVHSALP